MYIISTLKLSIAALIIGLVCASSMILYFEFCRFRELPNVDFLPNGQCSSVINFRNGDAYNCNDVNVILRRYHSNTIASGVPHK